MWCPVRPTRRIACLAYDARGDVCICADEEVRLDVLKHDDAVFCETSSRMDARGCAARGLKCLFKRQHDPYGPLKREREPRHQRFDLRPPLSAETSAGVGCNYSNARDRQLQCGSNDPLQHIWMLRRTPHGDAVRIGGCKKCVRLDGEMRDHWKC